MAPFSKTLQLIGPCSLFLLLKFFEKKEVRSLKKSNCIRKHKLAQGNVISYS